MGRERLKRCHGEERQLKATVKERIQAERTEGNEHIEAAAVQGERPAAVGPRGEGRAEQPPRTALFTQERVSPLSPGR